MSSFYDNFKKKAQNVSKGIYAQANPFDGGRTYDTNQRGVNPGVANPVNMRSDNTPEFQLSNNSLTRGISRGADQLNIADGGRTWKQRAPSFTNIGVGTQLTHNGATNLIGNTVAKPLLRSSMALNQGIGNAEVALAHKLGLAKDIKTQNAQQYSQGTGIKNLQNFSGYTGTKQQITGDAVSNVANVAFPGSSKIVKGAFQNVAPKVVPQVVNRAVANAGTGAVTGGVSNLGAEMSADRIKSAQDARNAIKSGAQFGAALGAGGTLALPVVKAGAKAARPVAQKTGQATTQAAKTVANKASLVDPELTKLSTQYKKAYDVETNPTRKRQISQAIAELNGQIRAKAQGGYIGGSKQPKANYRSAHQIDNSTSLNVGNSNNIDDLVATIKSKYGLTNYDQKDIARLKKISGNPEADVKIYRASPINELNDGDWVTTSRTYANDIKRQNGGRVYEYSIKARDLNLPANIEDNPSLARFSAFQYSKNSKPSIASRLKPKPLNEGGYINMGKEYVKPGRSNNAIEMYKGGKFEPNEKLPKPLQNLERLARESISPEDFRAKALDDLSFDDMGIALKNNPKAKTTASQFFNDFKDYDQVASGRSVKDVPFKDLEDFYRQVNDPTYRFNPAQQSFDKAREQIESGKAAYGASEDYAKLATKAVESPQNQTPQVLANIAKSTPGQSTKELGLPQLRKQPSGLSGTQVEPPRAKSPVVEPSQQPTLGSAKLDQSSTSTIPQKPLQVYGTNKVSNLDKVFRSTRSIIERQGESGKQLGAMLQKTRDNREIYLANIEKQMPSVSKIARKGKNALVNKDFENFVEATQGLAEPKNPLVAKAVQEWQATHPQIRDRAVAAGLDVGDLGPTYYPHFVDYDRIFKDKNTYNEAINHLTQTGQAKSPEDAIKLLGYARDVSRNRQFGNLESSRLIDLPFYDKTPNSFISYLNGSVDRITKTEMFGAKDENALKLIAKAAQEGADTEAMKNAFDIAVGAKQYNPTTSAVSTGIRKYITTTRLGLGALTNVSQNVNTGIVTGHMRTLKSAVKQLSPETRQFVQETGVIADAVLNDIKTQQGYSSFSSKVFGKAVNKVTAPGFGLVEKTNRSIAATAGRDYALRLAQKGDEATLRKLGVTGDISKKTLTEAQQIQAARKIVEKTQFKVDAQDLPGWTDSPGGKLVAQFRTFSYSQGKFFSNEVLKPLGKGNAMPLARVLAALPVGYALYETRRMIDGRPAEEDGTKVGLESFSKIGGAGLALDMYRGMNPVGSKYIPSDRRVSMAAGTFGGPAVGTAIQAVGALSEGIQRKNTPEDETRLDGKVAVGKTDNSYSDLTPLARFGLQQIPIVGTPIKNRVLPYKKESDSDKGFSTIPSLPGTAKASALAPGNAVPMSTKEKKSLYTAGLGKEFMALSEDDKKASPLYSQYKAMERSFTNRDQPSDLKPELAQFLDRHSRLTDEARTKKENTQNDYEYKLAVANYEKGKSKLTKVEQMKKQNELKGMAVRSKFSKDTRELYAMSKENIDTYVAANPLTKAQVNELYAIDKAEVENGLRKYTKFTGSGGSKSKGGSKGKGKKLAMPNFSNVGINTKTPNLKVSMPKVAPIKKPVFKKPKKA